MALAKLIQLLIITFLMVKVFKYPIFINLDIIQHLK